MDQRRIMVESAIGIAEKAGCGHIFIFLDIVSDCKWFS